MSIRSRDLNRLTPEQKHRIQQAIQAGYTHKQLATLYYEITGKRPEDRDMPYLVAWFKNGMTVNVLADSAAIGSAVAAGVAGGGAVAVGAMPEPNALAVAERHAAAYERMAIDKPEGVKYVSVVADIEFADGTVAEQLMTFDKPADGSLSTDEVAQAVEDFYEQLAHYPERLKHWLRDGGDKTELASADLRHQLGGTEGVRVVGRRSGVSDYTPEANRQPVMTGWRLVNIDSNEPG